MRASATLGISRRNVLSLFAPARFGAGWRIWNMSAVKLDCMLFLLLALSMCAQAQVLSPSQNSSNNDDIIHVKVNMVVLHATVQNRKGNLVSGLSKDDFRIYEDGVLQQLKHFSHEDIPVTVGLVIDDSGSMRTKRNAVIAAAMAFARSSNPMDQMFVVKFNEKVSFALPENMLFTDNVKLLEVALSKIDADGETALYDAVSLSLERLKKGKQDKKILIVISDGGDNASKYTLAQVTALARKSDAIIYSIGIYDEQDSSSRPEVLKTFARDTGGKAYFPELLQDITSICEHIAHDIRNQYTLAYTPTNSTRDGSYRTIQVKAHGNLTVHTRNGYYAQPLHSTSSDN